MKTEKLYKSFAEFWPFYLSQHQNRINRYLHVVGSLLALGIIYFSTVKYVGVVFAIIAGYFCAWLGHFVFEKNRPATFQYPFYSFAADFKMIFTMLMGGSVHFSERKKKILVTGASRGIGLSIVVKSLEEGHEVIAAVRKKNSALENLERQFPNRFKIEVLDVANQNEIQSLAAKLSNESEDQEFIIVNNAGISGGAPFELMTHAHWAELYAVNVLGLVDVTRAFLPLLRKSKGKVINIGSISGRITSPLMTSYSSSKFAVRAISDGLRRELKLQNIAVVLIEPGPTATDIWQTSTDNSMKLVNSVSSELKDLYSDQISSLLADVKNISKSTISSNVVAASVSLAINLEKPEPYYRAGKNIHLIYLLSQYFPMAWLDRLLVKGLRFKKLK